MSYISHIINTSSFFSLSSQMLVISHNNNNKTRGNNSSSLFRIIPLSVHLHLLNATYHDLCIRFVFSFFFFSFCFALFPYKFWTLPGSMVKQTQFVCHWQINRFSKFYVRDLRCCCCCSIESDLVANPIWDAIPIDHFSFKDREKKKATN